MKIIPRSTVQAWFYVPFLVSGLAGCTNSRLGTADRVAPSAGISTLSTATAECEQRLRAKMEGKAIAFVPQAKATAAIDEANGALARLSQTQFTFRQIRRQTTSVAVEHRLRTQNELLQFQYDLSAGSEDSKSMRLTLSFHHIGPGQSLQLTQGFSVDAACETRLTETALETIVGDGNDYKADTQTFYLDGTDQRRTDHFRLAADQRLTNLFLSNDSAKDFKTGDVNYSGDTGLLEYHLSRLPDAESTEFGLHFQWEITQAEIRLGEQTLLTVRFGEDRKSFIKFGEVSAQKSWVVTRDIWSIQSLGTAKSLDSFIESKLPPGYFDGHDGFRISVDRDFSYDHLAAYYDVIPLGIDSSSGLKTFRFNEKWPPLIHDKATETDLASNETIQTDLPQIQEIARGIRSQEPSDRRRQIELILGYLGTHYSYDQEMLKTNTVRPLKVAEALQRGKGVCQHYAVIFTTLARALKIPSRIVTGYLLSGGDSVGGHAWVEAEVEPGLWQVIEPQLENGLKETRTRQYLPLMRGTAFEDMNIPSLMGIAEMLNRNIRVEPAD